MSLLIFFFQIIPVKNNPVPRISKIYVGVNSPTSIRLELVASVVISGVGVGVGVRVAEGVELKAGKLSAAMMVNRLTIFCMILLSSVYSIVMS